MSGPAEGSIKRYVTCSNEDHDRGDEYQSQGKRSAVVEELVANEAVKEQDPQCCDNGA